MLPLGTTAPDFKLPDTNGKTVSLADFKDKPALLVMFMCNHCPYVKHIRAGLAQLARDYLPRGVGHRRHQLQRRGQLSRRQPGQDEGGSRNPPAILFPYLYDETQAVAKAYRAACTPDIYPFRQEPQAGLSRPVG